MPSTDIQIGQEQVEALGKVLDRLSTVARNAHKLARIPLDNDTEGGLPDELEAVFEGVSALTLEVGRLVDDAMGICGTGRHGWADPD